MCVYASVCWCFVDLESDEGYFIPLWSPALMCWPRQSKKSLRSGERDAGLSLCHISLKPPTAISLSPLSICALFVVSLFAFLLICCSLSLFWLCAQRIRRDKERTFMRHKITLSSNIFSQLETPRHLHCIYCTSKSYITHNHQWLKVELYYLWFQ